MRSAAAIAASVKALSEGGQSRTIKAYCSRRGWNPRFRSSSRFGRMYRAWATRASRILEGTMWNSVTWVSRIRPTQRQGGSWKNSRSVGSYRRVQYQGPRLSGLVDPDQREGIADSHELWPPPRPWPSRFCRYHLCGSQSQSFCRHGAL